MKSFILLLSTVVLFSACNPSSHENQKVELPTSLVLEMESEYVDVMTYDLFIDLPPRYYTSDDIYPVVYLQIPHKENHLFRSNVNHLYRPKVVLRHFWG